MNFELNEEQKIFRDSVYRFIKAEFEDKAEKFDNEELFVDKEVFKKLAELDLLGLTVKEEDGGSGADYFMGLLAVEQMGRISASLSLSYGAHSNLCLNNVALNANEEQKKKYLPGLISGDLVGCLGLTEPGAGSDAVGIKTTAVKKGDKYILNGSKTFITNAPCCDIALVYAKTDMSARAKGISAFIVEKDFPGFSNPSPMHKSGHRGSMTGDLVLEDCEVPAENLLGVENKGIAVMMKGLDLERTLLAGICIGMMQQAIELSIEYAASRKQFDQPIGDFQLIQSKLADMYVAYESSKLLTYKAACLAQQAHIGGKGSEIHKLGAAAILYAAEACHEVTNQAVQIHGGYGYTLDYEVNRLYRDAKLYEIGAGTSEVRRLVIGRELMLKGRL